uniref:Uncharacterized protein n=1 Tax=Falco tinnunculus TaxID=100819 RepID=A0A8C4TZ94_FALTI
APWCYPLLPTPAENRLLPTELRREALALQKELEFDTPGVGDTTSSQDDEYRWAGLEPPKVMVTTSREPSARLRVFAKVGWAVLAEPMGVEAGWVGLGGCGFLRPRPIYRGWGLW